MTPVYSNRRKRKQGAQADKANAVPNLSGDAQERGFEVLDRSGAAAEQWDSAYRQLFDRN